MSGLRSLAIGTLFGFGLGKIGFASWDEIHAMFTFADLRLVLTFAVCVSIVAALWVVLLRRGPIPFGSRSIHRGTVPGSLLFGIGWAVTGACPSIAFVQAGEGQLGALVTIAGIVLGNYLYSRVNERYLHIASDSCSGA
ncbi:MAG: YeeE/YedE thiosulfate transporter family protein [Polyangiales bacterium]